MSQWDQHTGLIYSKVLQIMISLIEATFFGFLKVNLPRIITSIDLNTVPFPTVFIIPHPHVTPQLL